MIAASRLVDFFLDVRGHLWLTRMGILACAMGLAAIGITFVHSTTGGVDADVWLSAAARAQLVKGLIGFGALLVLLSIDYRDVERTSYYLYFALLGVLVLLLTLHRVANVRRWIDFGAFSVQPSELMKIVLIVTLASYLRYRRDQRSLAGFVRPLVWTAVPTALVVAQPDLGTSLMLPPVLLGMLYVSGARWAHLGAMVLVALLLVPAMLIIHHSLPDNVSERLVRSYQVDRVDAWLGLGEPERLKDTAYQLRQSENALIAGGWRGKGLGQGTRNRLGLLPARRTDFIFAVIGEEWGFVGTGCVVLLYLALIFGCLRVAVHSREPYGRLVAAGVAVLLAAQGFQNLGMTLRVTPITGLPLPFVSFGGSSLVTSFLAIGLVLSIAHRPVRVVASRDLSPRDVRRSVPLVDDHPGGANRFPNGPF